MTNQNINEGEKKNTQKLRDVESSTWLCMDFTYTKICARLLANISR